MVISKLQHLCSFLKIYRYHCVGAGFPRPPKQGWARRPRPYGFLLVLLFLSVLVPFCFPVFCEDLNVVAHVDRTNVELGSYLALDVEISGAKVSSPSVNLPEIDGFQSRDLGAATAVRINNGSVSSSVTFRYNLYPTKVGKFQIPALNVNANGQTFTTEPITIDVTDSGTAAPANASGAGGNGQVSLKDKIFLVMNTPKKEVYLNEKVPLTIRFFTSIAAEVNQYPEFDYVGFTADNLQEAKQYNQVVNGVQYKVIEFKIYVYPTRTGDLTLGPAKLPCNIILKGPDSRRDMFGDFGSMFGDDVFEKIFNNYESRPVELRSADIPIKVLPLPEEGKPKDFVETLGGAVGQFDMEASVSPTELKVGDPITLRLKITGNGNFKTVSMPVLQGDPTENQKNFKFYDPQVKDEEGAKTFEQVVIPAHDQVTELPAVSFPYFDVEQNQYKTVAKGPFPLKIQKPQPGEELKVVGLPSHPTETPTEQEEQLGRDISFIKDQPGYFRPSGLRLYKGLSFWLLNLFVLAMWGLLFIVYKIKYKIKTDVRFARRLQAPGHAKKGLQQAKGFLNQGQQKEFYDTIFKTLQNYFANKFHLQAGAINLETVKRAAKTNNSSIPVFEKLKTVFDECEMVRYASAQVDKEKMKTIYRSAEEIIDFSERNWR